VPQRAATRHRGGLFAGDNAGPYDEIAPLEPLVILHSMSHPRTMLLFDPDVQPQCWNERMAPGEYAVLYSSNQLASSVPHANTGGDPFCTVFSALSEAEQHAIQQVTLLPTLRCRIYDHHGLGSQPIREIRGSEHKGESEISSRFRRWCGSILFFGGIGLIVLDWSADFSLSWPATLGARTLPAGLVLLIIELVIVLEARRKSRRAKQSAQGSSIV